MVLWEEACCAGHGKWNGEGVVRLVHAAWCWHVSAVPNFAFCCQAHAGVEIVMAGAQTLSVELMGRELTERVDGRLSACLVGV